MNDVHATGLEALFIENLPVIDRATAIVARRHGFSPDETRDLTSWVHLRLVEDNYAALRKFRGESSIATYLTVVVAMLIRDYRAQHWGRWRPSASARRLGDVAMRLETLVHRNGLPLQQAGELLRTAGITTHTDRQLGNILSQLPSRRPLRPVEVGADSLAQVVASSSADTPMEVRQLNDERERCRALVEQALDALPVEDRLILRLRFWENVSIADIARGLHLEQKPLYRRLERLLAELRRSLTAAGLQPSQLQDLLDEPGS